MSTCPACLQPLIASTWRAALICPADFRDCCLAGRAVA